jgi:hypothetical protein
MALKNTAKNTSWQLAAEGLTGGAFSQANYNIAKLPLAIQY